MKGYGIYVKNDLLEPKHIKSIGNSLWEYLWCLDKITSIDENGVGKLLGGKPIKLKEMHEELGISEKHISIHLRELEKSGYVNLTRTGYGYLISVNKSVKIFGNKKRQNVRSEIRHNVTSTSKNVRSVSKNVVSNKTIQLDNTKTIQDSRGLSSKNKEKIRNALKSGNLKALRI